MDEQTLRKFGLRTAADDAAHREQQRTLFKGSCYGSMHHLSPEQANELENGLAAGPEEAIQRVITANPYFLRYVLRGTGHHGVWVFPKRMIRAQRADRTPGLIPDHLVAARKSLGYTWHIVELKRYDTQFANKNGDSLSTAGLKALVQCATYLTHFQDYIETVRSNVGVLEVVVPETVTVLIGDSALETQEQTTRRSEFRNLAPKVEVATYDRIRQGLASDLRSLS